MSHSTVLVVLPTGEKPSDLSAAVSPLLAPFEEAIDVPEYDRPCWCVGRTARNEARDAAQARVGTIDSLRASFHAARSPIPWPGGGASESEWKVYYKAEKARDAEWKVHIAPLNAAESEALAAHPLKDKPAPDCDECKGAGSYKSTWNPKARWDWWSVGGRWSETIPGNAALASAVLALDAAKRAIDPDESVMPFAILANGEWHERGKMGWFGCVSNEQGEPAWDARARSILGDFADRMTVLVDVHI